MHIQSEIGAYEAEEIGVEHLLRDVKDSTVSTLATEVRLRILAASDDSLQGVGSHLYPASDL